MFLLNFSSCTLCTQETGDWWAADDGCSAESDDGMAVMVHAGRICSDGTSNEDITPVILHRTSYNSFGEGVHRNSKLF